MATYQLINFVNRTFMAVGTWNSSNNYTTGPSLTNTSITWFDGTKNVPNFNPTKKYLNCDLKTVFYSQNVSFSDPSIIDGRYQCDGYIDCDSEFFFECFFPIYTHFFS